MRESELPTTEWEHAHALKAGMELVDTNTGTEITVTEVDDDGSVTVLAWFGERKKSEYTTETWTEREANTGLSHGEIETTDGKSHELATY